MRPDNRVGRSLGYGISQTAGGLPVLLIGCLAQFVVALNATVVVVALPLIQADLGFSAQDLTWILNAYILTIGGFLLLAGRAGDLLGHKRVLLAGASIFTIASLVAAVSISAGILVAARALQGIAAALVVPSALSIVIATFGDGVKRRRALSVWGAANSVGASVAFVVGGVLTELLTWRAIFFINVPYGLMIVGAIHRWMPESRRSFAPHMDIAGALLFTGTAIMLVYGVVRVNQVGLLDPLAAVAAATTLVGGVMLVIVEHGRQDPLVRLGIFRIRTFTVAIGGATIVAGAALVTAYLAALYFQEALHFSPLTTGVAFLPMMIVLSVAALSTHALLGRAKVHWVMPAVLALMGLGAGLFAVVGMNSGYGASLLGLVMIYAGVGCASVIVTILASTRLSENEVGMASGLISTSFQVGGAVWLAVFSSVALASTTLVGSGGAGQEMVSGYRTGLFVVALLLIVWSAATAAILRPRSASPR
ncbi:MFS transporter [Phytoactinopolyspora limicola]|uniref:MFS transporter n=1 Tax=Phytoactinopolyspora limicola TaxID=2715536 RepID=UPI00140D3419|nr:MFS transporter [Phytoactinopolyspora limicola]